MKKQEKIDLIEKSIAEKEICRCFFSYDPGYIYCYPNAVNDRFILGQEEDDFLILLIEQQSLRVTGGFGFLKKCKVCLTF